MHTKLPNVYLIMAGVRPGQKPPGRVVECRSCSHWEGSDRLETGARCAVLGGLHPADFGCAYFQRGPERG